MDMLTEMPIPLTVRLQECPSGKESRRKRATLSSDPLLFCNFNTNSSYTSFISLDRCVTSTYRQISLNWRPYDNQSILARAANRPLSLHPCNKLFFE